MIDVFAALVVSVAGLQQVAPAAPVRVQSIGPKQDDPRTQCGTPGRTIIVQGGSPARGIVVQGGREAIGPKQDDPRKLAIGPKQDDPLTPGTLSRPGDDNDPKASGGSGHSIRGIVVQGGREAIGPKQDDPRALAIGPKQDDPLTLGTHARPGDDNDPKAAGICEAPHSH
ncbi:hypothetical protein G7078_03100 [Sphingomonas sinipercae]|uniref:Uncharacterized protein n=1 Tax=Sphingomonas sinipercae TaxID=2714944 RepID=A0A6G7ZLQ9_9SPHN|nr:hypothetical protein [Sphingomonas sinipercae]QIL01873.1 hypothetical protein G7078_03100 [Sphingomonas sinipercae]